MVKKRNLESYSTPRFSQKNIVDKTWNGTPSKEKRNHHVIPSYLMVKQGAQRILCMW